MKSGGLILLIQAASELTPVTTIKALIWAFIVPEITFRFSVRIRLLLKNLA